VEGKTMKWEKPLIELALASDLMGCQSDKDEP